MTAKYQDIGKRIDEALSGMDYDVCRKMLTIEDMQGGEFLRRLEESGADLERLLVTAIATTIIQSRAIDEMQEAVASQRAAVDTAADSLTLLRKKLQHEIDAAGVGRPSEKEDHMTRLKEMIAKPGVH